MNEEERERIMAHLREQLAYAGVRSPDERVLPVLAKYVHESRMATAPAGYARAYQIIEWCLKQAGMER